MKRFACFLFCFLFLVSAPAHSATMNLEQVIRQTCLKSDSARMMEETVVKSELMIREQWAAAFPSASGFVNAARQYSLAALPMLPKPELSGTPYYGMGVQISQPLCTFGKVGNGIRAAAHYDSSIQQANIRNFQQLQLSAMDGFFQAVLSQMKLAVTARSLERKQELLRFLNRNFELGSDSKAQLLATQADLKSQRTEIIQDDQKVRTSKMILCTYVGITLADSLDLDTAFMLPDLLSTPLPGEAEIVQSALSSRSDLASIEHLAHAAQLGAKIYRAMYLPNLAGQASFGTGGTDPEDLFDPDTKNWTVGIGMQWHFFDGLSSGTKAAQYRSDARKLEIARDAMKKMIGIEVLSALAECAAADSNRTASAEILVAAREGYALTATNFKQGSGQFIEVQNADERLLLAEMGDTHARYRVLRSRAALRVAMGRNIINMEGI